MSDDRLDALSESARNRGLKLVRSRVRTPGKRGFGKVGLTDKTGKAVFGMDDKGPIAMPEEVENYLRNLGARDWGASLDVAVVPRKRKPSKVLPHPANDRKPEARRKAEPQTAKPKPAPPPPTPKIREAKPSDAGEIVKLNRLLGAEVSAKTVQKGIKALARDRLAPLVATLDKNVVGVCSINLMMTIHRDCPVGRISHLVVAEQARGQGIGRMLTEAAEQRLKKLGCGMVEVTSNDRLAKAHAFYRHLGYERTSIRFMKKL
jgi:ribosomal protein S18 acetylase RimI-like enzyme